jgi:hypothetical protein
MLCLMLSWLCDLQKSNSKYGNEHEAVAVYSMMRGVEKFCPIYTLCIGNAFGEAALLLAAGSKVRQPHRRTKSSSSSSSRHFIHWLRDRDLLPLPVSVETSSMPTHSCLRRRDACGVGGCISDASTGRANALWLKCIFLYYHLAFGLASRQVVQHSLSCLSL